MRFVLAIEILGFCFKLTYEDISLNKLSWNRRSHVQIYANPKLARENALCEYAHRFQVRLSIRGLPLIR